MSYRPQLRKPIISPSAQMARTLARQHVLYPHTLWDDRLKRDIVSAISEGWVTREEIKAVHKFDDAMVDALFGPRVPA